MSPEDGGAISRLRQFLLLNPCLILAIALAALLILEDDGQLPTVDLDYSRTVDLQGRIASPPEMTSEYCYFRLEVDGLWQKELSVAYTGQVEVYLSLTEETLNQLKAAPMVLGERLRMTTLLQFPDHYEVPGVRDFREGFWGQGVLHRIRLKSLLQIERLGLAPNWEWSAFLSRYLESFNAFCRDRLDDRSADLVRSVFLGRKRALDPEERQQIRDLGILHLFVVSGFHLSLVVACCHLLLRRCGTLGSLGTLVCVWGYVLMTGSGIPTLRAGIMASLFYSFWLSGLQSQILNSLGISALIVLFLWPLTVASAGFQFSYLSLLAIGLYVVPWARSQRLLVNLGSTLWREGLTTDRSVEHQRARRLRFRLEDYLDPAPRWIARSGVVAVCRTTFYVGGILVCGLWIQAFLFPVTVFYSNLAVWTQALANLLTVPLFALFLPACLSIFLLHWTPAGGPLGSVVSLLAALIQHAMELSGRISYSSHLPHPRFWESSFYYILFFLLSLIIRNRVRLLALALPLAMLPVLRLQPAGDDRLVITMLDVGQAESIHLKYPNGSEALVDCAGRRREGNSSHPHFYGERIVGRYLWEERTPALDYVLVSHPDSDHMQGLEFLRSAFPIGRLYFHEGHESYACLQLQFLSTGDRYDIGDVQHLVLHPNRVPGSPTSDNDNSLVVLLRYREFTMLLTGDVEKRGELEVLSRLTRVTVLKVAHHGGKSSNSTRMIEATRPVIALVSAGRRNPFGHPSQEVLDRFRERAIPVLSTAEHGSLRLETDGSCLTVSQYEPRARGFRVIPEVSGECSWAHVSGKPPR